MASLFSHLRTAFWPICKSNDDVHRDWRREGGSLQLWKRYFGPFAQIIGIDNNPACKTFEEDHISIRIGDQSDPLFLQQIIDEFGYPDVVLDDGSHIMNHIAASFEFFYPLMDKNGVYLVEDLHTAYLVKFGGGLHEPNSFIERSKKLIDELNADYTEGALPVSEFSRTTLSMHFYDSVVVFERGQHIKKQPTTIGRKHRSLLKKIGLKK